MIEVRAVRKAFGPVRAVNGLSFVAHNGAITGLLGPNGAGKTTTLRMLYTLMRPDEGEVLIDGVDAVAHPLVARRALGVLPDARGIYTRLTARENIEYFARLHGLEAAAAAAHTAAMLHELDMHEYADRRASGFSHGQRLKVALGRALVHEPRNVVLDEPTNGLDVLSTRALRTLLRRLRDSGRCVLLSTHVMQEVAALCDRILVMARGQLVAAGSADELRALTGEAQLEDAFLKLIGADAAELA